MKARRNKYISSREEVLSLTYLLLSEKEDDIRTVYNGMSSGLDEVLWDPYFTLPTMSTHMRSIQLGTNMRDIDIGEKFQTL